MQLNGKHEASQANVCCPRNGKQVSPSDDKPPRKTTVRTAWEGEAAKLASPDTGQNRWKCATGDVRDAAGLFYAPCQSIQFSVTAFPFNPAHGEVGRLPFTEESP